MILWIISSSSSLSRYIQRQTMGNKKDTEIENERKKGRKYTRITMMKRNRTATEQSNCIISRQCWWGPNLLLCIYLSDKSSSHFVLSAALYIVQCACIWWIFFSQRINKKKRTQKFRRKKKFIGKKTTKTPIFAQRIVQLLKVCAQKMKTSAQQCRLKSLLLKAKKQNRTKKYATMHNMTRSCPLDCAKQNCLKMRVVFPLTKIVLSWFWTSFFRSVSNRFWSNDITIPNKKQQIPKIWK